MTAIVLGMLLCLGAAAAVVALVAIPARRQGRALLTERGEGVFAGVRERTDVAAARTRDAAVRVRKRGHDSTDEAGASAVDDDGAGDDVGDGGDGDETLGHRVAQTERASV